MASYNAHQGIAVLPNGDASFQRDLSVDNCAGEAHADVGQILDEENALIEDLFGDDDEGGNDMEHNTQWMDVPSMRIRSSRSSYAVSSGVLRTNIVSSAHI